MNLETNHWVGTENKLPILAYYSAFYLAVLIFVELKGAMGDVSTNTFRPIGLF